MRELGGHNGTADAASEVRGPRRRFLAVAVPDYGDRDEEFTRGIAEQLDVLHAWWCDASLGGDRFTPHTAPPPAGRRDVENFLHEVGVRDAGPEDVLVLCIAGHGVTSPSGQHFLRLPRTRTGRLHTTAYRTADLLAACLDSRAGHVLAIVNTCEAGAVEAELAQLRKDLGARRRREAGLTVLATSDFQETVRVRALAVLLQRVHCQLRTSAEIVEPLLTVDEFAYELDRAARRTPQPGALPRLLLEPADRYAPSPCLPNPGHRPPDDVVAPQRQPVAARRAELDFWVGRAAGAESGDAGWYFSGRRGHTKVLADFLAASAPGGALLVTGPAGSGKSALIARAVTLADPGFRQDPRYAAALRDTPPETMPPPGAVDVAVLARQMETRIIIEGLLAGLGREPAPPGLGTDRVEQLREELRGRERPTTLVIDGLDEAHHPADVVSRLLAPLAPLTAAGPTGRPALRLVVGVRSPEHADPEAADGLLPLVRRTLAAHGEPAELRTDTADTAEDIAAYVQALLSPLREGVPEIAGTIAAATSPSFLDARLAAQQLRPPHDALEQFRSPQWRASLGAGTVGLLRRDLADTGSAELPRDTALALLRASAFAQGAGIPWADVWPAVAEAVAGLPVPDADRAIAALLGGRLAGYLTRDTEDGRAVHRPAHARLAEVLREAPHLLAGAAGAEEQPLTGGTDEAAVHRRIAARLAELGTAGAGGLAPHPYVRRHLVRHAALGGALDDAAVPASLLAHESSGTVRAQLGLPVSADAGRTWLAAWARVEPFLLGADAASRASSLHLAHYALTATAGAPDVSPVAGTCIQPLWSAWHVPGNVLARTAAAVNDLATVPGPGGCTLLAGALEDGTVGVWDAATGAPLGPPRAGHDGHVRAVVAVSPAEGPPLLVSAGADAVARCRDPLAGIPAGAPLSLGDGPVTALAALGDGTLFAAAGHGPRVRVWDPFADREARAFPTGHPGGVRALAAFPGQDGRERLATAGWDGVVRQWDPLTGDAAGPALTGHAGSVAAVAAFADGPRTLLATGGVDGTLRLWDPATGSPHGPPLGGAGSVAAVAAFADGPRTLLATGGVDGTLRLWDP
ncbi:AAA family ATPase, partial [Streptomyces sp. NPDC090026]|uniref:AAA family ATPase n=1 Tax=Streptomyces sp. NPDC090026 TaxID=3365923 RepID=UPI00382AD781